MKQKAVLFNWTRIIAIAIIILIIILIVYFGLFYRSILQSKTEDYERTKSVVRESLNMNINEIYSFQEKEGYHILFTTDNKNKDWIVFVPLSEELKKENFIVIENNEVLSKEEIESLWQNNCKNCELIKSKPAMIDNIPLWELTYKDQSSRYVIEYITLKDGTTYEQLRLIRKYSEKG